MDAGYHVPVFHQLRLPPSAGVSGRIAPIYAVVGNRAWIEKLPIAPTAPVNRWSSKAAVTVAVAGRVDVEPSANTEPMSFVPATDALRHQTSIHHMRWNRGLRHPVIAGSATAIQTTPCESVEEREACAVELVGDGLDAVLINLYDALLRDGVPNKSTIGDSVELLGVTLRISKPRARVSRSETRARPFSALGELLWYLSGSDEAAFVIPYIPFYGKEGKPSIVNGAYGPRIRHRHGFDQLEAVMDMMRRKDGSRRAVIQLYEAKDLLTDEDVPCTTTMQFHRRGDVLHMSVTMRSNDAYLGLPHDIFCFTMLQELVATELGLHLGEYIHMVGSMHLYERDLANAERYRSEGFQRAAEMPQMSSYSPFEMVQRLLAFEHEVREGRTVDPDEALQDPYWADLGRLIQINFAGSDDEAIKEISTGMKDSAYHSSIEDHRDRKLLAGRKAAIVAGSGVEAS